MWAQLNRNFFLALAKQRWLNQAARKWGYRLGASQVVAGDRLEQAIAKVNDLNQQGLVCTLDHLGEFVTNRSEALEATQQNIDTLKAIYQAKVNSHLSVKLTQLGVDIDPDFCLNNMKEILKTAKETHNFVRIDMEDYAHVQITLDLLKELRRDYDNVGTAIQAYLYRSEQDVKDLQGVSLRLVKGAYKESSQVAIQDNEQIKQNLLRLIKLHLLSGSYTAIATHDKQVIQLVKTFIKESQIPSDQFEFQMLYGFDSHLQLALCEEGYNVRVYVPFGVDWFGYFMRRLAERPQNVTFALKGIFSK